MAKHGPDEQGPNSSPVPLIIDSDMFSNADDAGAVGTAFALQGRGEANVLAITLNTRTSRPTVATDSYRCAAAIANFYGAGDIPIGTQTPTGNVTGSPYITACGQLAPRWLPAPENAVSVLRRSLASQRDGSVVLAEIGYEGNLAALLQSRPDRYSRLSGEELVARKVRMLVAVAGINPVSGIWGPENNLRGDPVAAQTVAARWPTKLVWDGAQIGDNTPAGGSIDSTPANNPVRVAFDAYNTVGRGVPAGSPIAAYDLTAVYHAVRPNDPSLVEVGPGAMAIDSLGNNTFTPGATNIFGVSNQYYLTLANGPALSASLDQLIDTTPAGQGDGHGRGHGHHHQVTGHDARRGRR